MMAVNPARNLARKQAAQAKLEREAKSRLELATARARSRHTRLPTRESVYYQTPDQKRYWEKKYPAKIRSMSPEARVIMARKRGMDDVFPGWDDPQQFPEVVTQHMAEYYLLGFLSRGRNDDAYEQRERAKELYAQFTGHDPDFKAFREAYSKQFD